jgi:predicted small metal-binding protein
MTKVIHCPCGTDVKGETDDELVANVESHVAEAHAGSEAPGREQILSSAHEH